MTDPSNTKTRLLDSAEQLFAERGYAETSLRELTQSARCNLAAVNYHFGSKQALAHAVIARRVDPINAQRIEQLDRLEAAGPPDLEQVLHAFVEPVVRDHGDSPGSMTQIARLLIQLTTLGDRSPEENQQLFRQVSERFIPAFQRALPEVDAASVFWRINFTIAVVAMSFCQPERLSYISQGQCDPHDAKEALRQMVAFLAAGLRAPAARQDAKEREIA